MFQDMCRHAPFEHVTARVDAICCSFFLCAQFSVTSVFNTCVSQSEHTNAHAVAQVDRFEKGSHTFMVAEPFAKTKKIHCALPCPQNRLSSAWELLQESLEQRVSARRYAATKHSKVSIKK